MHARKQNQIADDFTVHTIYQLFLYRILYQIRANLPKLNLTNFFFSQKILTSLFSLDVAGRPRPRLRRWFACGLADAFYKQKKAYRHKHPEKI